MKKSIIIILFAFACASASAAKYSCLSIITEAKAIGRWGAVKGWIDAAGLSDEWGKCNCVSDSYPQFSTITNALVVGGVLTNEEIAGILKRSVDNDDQNELFKSMYTRDMSSEVGRTKWHGRRVKTEEDMKNLVQTFTYEDGYRFSQPFTRSSALTVKQRFDLKKKQQEEAERKRLAQLPPGLRKVQTQRQSNASTTNEVTVHYGQTGSN